MRVLLRIERTKVNESLLDVKRMHNFSDVE